MSKITAGQAVEYVQKARKLQSESQGLRFGQSLFTVLPDTLCNEHLSKDTDFYYWLDDNEVLTCFYDHYVENH